jgi:hypothetical protein
MTTVPATCRVASGALLLFLATAAVADETPDTVACPCSDVYVAARAAYDKLPGPSLCQSARSKGDEEWNELTVAAAKGELTGSKWRRVSLTMEASEYCMGIRCASCSAYVHAEKKLALFLHKLVGGHHSRLSDEELAACQAQMRALVKQDCSPP